MAVLEIEIWGEKRDTDYARLLTKLDEETATELYKYLYLTSRDWCDDRGVSPEIFRRTTGKDVQLADVLQWYTEEGLLKQIEVEGDTAFLPTPPVQDKLEGSISKSVLVKIDD